jgi:alkane 1-monooxygenase
MQIHPMASASETDTVGGALPARKVAWIWLRHLTSLYFPAASLLFIWTGPHPWYVAPLFLGTSVLAFVFDDASRGEPRQPEAALPAWPFDALVYVLAGLQLLIVFELVRTFAHQSFFSVDTVMIFIVVGGSSGFSIITAHELIHRSRRWEQQLGRLLLCTVLYEHFYTEHLRGHHVRVGTPEDPATARFGEDYESFFRRTVPAQFRSAWRLELRRLGDEGTSLLDPRMLRNRILHGMALGWGMACAAWLAFGFTAFAAFVLQALMAVRLLEAVNYMEHWGLVRQKRRVRPTDSWDTHSWFTYYGLTGLSRHADHHAEPSRPFQQLRIWDEAPILPSGYVGSVDMVIERNAEFQRLATEELRRRKLGPFVTVGGAVGERAEVDERAVAADGGAGAGERGGVRRRWDALPAPARLVTFMLGFTALVSLGGWLEAGRGSGFAALFALNAWILTAFALALRVRRVSEERLGSFALSWVVGFGLLFSLGKLTQALLG